MTSEDRDDPGSLPRLMATYGHVGMMFPVSIGLGVLLGYWADGRLGTLPWLTIGGFALGVAAAVRNLIQTVSRQERRERERADAELRGRRRARRQDPPAGADELDRDSHPGDEGNGPGGRATR